MTLSVLRSVVISLGAILTSFCAISLFSLPPHEKGIKKQTLCLWLGKENYCEVDKKKKQHNFTRQRYVLSFKGGTLLLREKETMLRSRDVIHRGSASFWWMIHVFVSVVIAGLKKKGLLFDSSSYIYIRGSLIKFPNFFRMSTFIYSIHM